MKAQFKLDAKLLIGYKTKRSAEACRLLAEAGFTSLYNVESRSFVKTREQQAWEWPIYNNRVTKYWNQEEIGKMTLFPR